PQQINQVPKFLKLNDRGSLRGKVPRIFRRLFLKDGSAALIWRVLGTCSVGRDKHFRAALRIAQLSLGSGPARRLSTGCHALLHCLDSVNYLRGWSCRGSRLVVTCVTREQKWNVVVSK